MKLMELMNSTQLLLRQ
ncbi:unnamed protein product [Calypogeia fissa]